LASFIVILMSCQRPSPVSGNGKSERFRTPTLPALLPAELRKHDDWDSACGYGHNLDVIAYMIGHGPDESRRVVSRRLALGWLVSMSTLLVMPLGQAVRAPSDHQMTVVVKDGWVLLRDDIE
jgi:hypothetical protein